ncbi:hypothetical protein DFR70_108118 [Nocardia tenerifensis]|uniref:Uncharacterized protein n=1 Tax=Nocardia tenerifensis TaxID=228006 RepID=A0A318JW93_9NOCA|nr:hypothetical protein DFR70_108118 [Nocardia tenerifensis]
MTCPSCSWPTPTLVSAHGSVAYLRCVCGQWLIAEFGLVVATTGNSSFGMRDKPHRGDGPERPCRAEYSG